MEPRANKHDLLRGGCSDSGNDLLWSSGGGSIRWWKMVVVEMMGSNGDGTGMRLEVSQPRPLLKGYEKPKARTILQSPVK
ncbi:hypothetical protein Tco_0503734 [Tanacetum coccineum]